MALTLVDERPYIGADTMGTWKIMSYRLTEPTLTQSLDLAALFPNTAPSAVGLCSLIGWIGGSNILRISLGTKPFWIGKSEGQTVYADFDRLPQQAERSTKDSRIISFTYDSTPSATDELLIDFYFRHS
jgi:hypothetical protein